MSELQGTPVVPPAEAAPAAAAPAPAPAPAAAVPAPGATAATEQAGGRGLGGLGRGGFQQLRQQSAQQAEAAKRAAAERAAAAKAEADRISEQNPEVAAARAAAEQKAAVAREEGERLANENKAILQQNADAARNAAQEMQEMKHMTPEERQAAMAQKAIAAKGAGDQLYAQNKAMLEKNKAAADAAKRDAERTAQEAKAQAAVLGTQAVTAGVNAGMNAAHTAVNIARDDFERRCAAAQAKDEQLRSVAMEVEKREKQLSMIMAKTQPNWPRKCCCIEPMVHHDILGDIPPERQSFVTWSYRNYFFTCFMLVMNCALAVTMLLMENQKDEETGEKKKTDDSDAIQHMGISILYLTGIAFAFMTWYWPVYRACGTGSYTQYIMAFIGLGVAVAFTAFTAIGPVGYGGTGLIWAMEVNSNKGDNAFIPAIIIAVLWLLQTCFFIWMIWRMYKYYKEDKSSFVKAKGEMLASAVTGK